MEQPQAAERPAPPNAQQPGSAGAALPPAHQPAGAVGAGGLERGARAPGGGPGKAAGPGQTRRAAAAAAGAAAAQAPRANGPADAAGSGQDGMPDAAGEAAQAAGGARAPGAPHAAEAPTPLSNGDAEEVADGEDAATVLTAPFRVCSTIACALSTCSARAGACMPVFTSFTSIDCLSQQLGWSREVPLKHGCPSRRGIRPRQRLRGAARTCPTSRRSGRRGRARGSP